MLKINDKVYNNIIIKVTYGNYSVTQMGNKREGISPIICFIGDDFYVRLETTYDQKWFNKTNFNNIIDITRYISDISFEDKNGWMSLIGKKISCKLKKIEDKLFNIEFICDYEDFSEELHININEDFKI